jgi:hypothetical protein
LGRGDGRKGGVPKERVLNCLGRHELAFYLEKRRDRRVKFVSLQDGKPRLRTPTSGVKKPCRSAQASGGHQPLIFQALLPTPANLDDLSLYPGHSHRERIVSASAVSICSV